MAWLTILRLVLTFASRLAAIIREKRLMQAGAAHAMREALIAQQVQVNTALEARRKIRAVLKKHPGSLHDNDGFRRD